METSHAYSEYQPTESVTIERFSVPTGNRYGPVNIFVLTSGSEKLLIESGPLPSAGRDNVKNLVDRGDIPVTDIDRVFLTHHHWDHVGGSFTIQEIRELPHIVFRDKGKEILSNYPAYITEVDRCFRTGRTNDAWYTHLQEDVYSTWQPLQTPNIDRIVEPGGWITIGNLDWKIIHTPGHEHNHMSLYSQATGILFLGDLTNERGYFEMGTTASSIGEYVETLDKLENLPIAEIYLGHEPPIRSETDEYIQLCQTKQHGLVDKIVQAVGDGHHTTPAIAKVCFGAMKDSARPWTERIIEKYIEYIVMADDSTAALPQSYSNGL